MWTTWSSASLNSVDARRRPASSETPYRRAPPAWQYLRPTYTAEKFESALPFSFVRWGGSPGTLGLKPHAPRRLHWRARGRWLTLGRAVALASLLAAPARADDPLRTAETRLAGMVISSDLERRLGLQFKNELETKKGVVYLEDEVVVEYVRAVAARVIDVARRERPDVQWNVMVINDWRIVNAMATPGGFLYVYRGLLEFVNDEAELAGIMADEAGHVVARHTARDMVAAYGLDAVSRLALGRNAGLLARLAAGVGTKGLLLAHSREDETEADEYGARYAAAAGYDPKALVRFFGNLKRRHGSESGLQAYLSDYPAPADRFEHVTAYIAEHGYTGAQSEPARVREDETVPRHVVHRLARAGADGARQSGAMRPSWPQHRCCVHWTLSATTVL